MAFWTAVPPREPFKAFADITLRRVGRAQWRIVPLQKQRVFSSLRKYQGIEIAWKTTVALHPAERSSTNLVARSEISPFRSYFNWNWIEAKWNVYTADFFFCSFDEIVSQSLNNFDRFVFRVTLGSRSFLFDPLNIVRSAYFAVIMDTRDTNITTKESGLRGCFILKAAVSCSRRSELI